MTLDLDAYLTRIGWAGRPEPTGLALRSLLRAHMAAIPFENLDVLLGRGIRLDVDSLIAKLIVARRGGYCFEHTTLFQAVLERIGFPVRAHAARVIMLTPKAEAARTHMFLTVDVEGTSVVVDPGFGGHGPLVDLPLAEGVEVRDGTDLHRFVRQDDEWVLQAQIDGRMVSLWTSTLEVQHPIDFVMANHYVSTFPESPFVNRLMLRALTPSGRVSVMNRDVTIRSGGTSTSGQLADRRALRDLLVEYFGFDLPDVERLRIPTVPEWACADV
jgi:N-hydroxyarylamine O-acetyltransferase